MKNFINMLRDKRGASAAEYALILAIIGAVIALAALALADAIGIAMYNTAAFKKNPTTGTCKIWGAAAPERGRSNFSPACCRLVVYVRTACSGGPGT